MRIFKDNAGRDWTIAVNVTTIKRIRDLAKVDLLDNLGVSLTEKMNADPIIVCDILYAAVKPQADALSVTQEQFGDALDGDVIAAGSEALIEELINFFPPRRRQAIRQAMAKMESMETLAMTRAVEKINAIDERKLVESVSNNESGNLPERSESTQAH